MVDYFKKKLTREMEFHLTTEQDGEPPWTFTKIHMKYILAGEGLDAKQVEKAIELSEEKYCSVAATLRGKAEITWDYVIE